MNEDLIGNCRACGQIVSKNLVKGCPHCGESEPHLTKEVASLRKEDAHLEHKRWLKEIEENRRNEARSEWFAAGCMTTIGILIILFIYLVPVYC